MAIVITDTNTPRYCCGAASAIHGCVGCANCETVAQHDTDVANSPAAPCVRCVDGADDHDYVPADGTRRVTISVESYVPETVNGYTFQDDYVSETATLYGLTPADAVAYLTGVYPYEVEAVHGGLRFYSEPTVVDYQTYRYEATTATITGYSPLTLTVVGSRVLTCRACTVNDGPGHPGHCTTEDIRQAVAQSR